MNTAILIGKRHDGQWQTICNPGVPILEQRKRLHEMAAKGVSEEFATVEMWESVCGRTRKLTLTKHAAQKPAPAPAPAPTAPVANPNTNTKTKTK